MRHGNGAPRALPAFIKNNLARIAARQPVWKARRRARGPGCRRGNARGLPTAHCRPGPVSTENTSARRRLGLRAPPPRPGWRNSHLVAPLRTCVATCMFASSSIEHRDLSGPSCASDAPIPTFNPLPFARLAGAQRTRVAKLWWNEEVVLPLESAGSPTRSVGQRETSA